MKALMKTFHIIGALSLMWVRAQAVHAQTATARMVTTTKSFLSSLDEKQRARVLFAFTDDKQRARWSNFPNQIFPRAGLSLGELNPTQRAAAMAVVSAAPSRRPTRCSRPCGRPRAPRMPPASQTAESARSPRAGSGPAASRSCRAVRYLLPASVAATIGCAAPRSVARCAAARAAPARSPVDAANRASSERNVAR
jgi:hypothetical protein